MNGCVLHFTKIKPGSTLASGRIAHWLAQRYGIPVYDEQADHVPYDAVHDVVFLVSSPSGFTSAYGPGWREQLGALCARAKTYIFVQNDFMTTQAGQIFKGFDLVGKPRKRLVWSTIPEQCRGTGSHYVNWNLLTWRPGAVLDHPVEREQAVFYYGALRSGRVKYFERYFGGDLPYRAVISTSKRMVKKWLAMTPNAEIIAPFDDVIAGASRYALSVYMEDAYSHKHYCSPANRFYECLSAGVPMAFDASTIGTMRKAGYDVGPYAVRSKEDVRLALENAPIWQRVQQAVWCRDYTAELEAMVVEAEKKAGIR